MVANAPSLFGHLVGRFAAHPENLATEALTFLLRKSPAAREGFVQLCRATRVDVDADLHFRSQANSQDGMIPDIEGCRRDGTRNVLVELKFWANLTENQPGGYLTLLPAEQTGLLLIVAPRSRQVSLWAKCLRRLGEEQHIQIESEESSPSGFRVARVGPHVMALTSWQQILSALEQKVAQMEDRTVLSDLHQLQGLADRMEYEGFAPFRHEDLAPERGRVQYQLVQLVDEVTQSLREYSYVSTEGLRTGGSSGTYGRYLSIHGFECFLAFTPRLWMGMWGAEEETPLWLVVREASDTATSARELLGPLQVESPPRVFFIKERESHVPLLVPVGLGRSEVVKQLVAQVGSAASYLEPTTEDQEGHIG